MIIMFSDEETDYLKHVTAVAYCGVDRGGREGGLVVTINPSQTFEPRISIHHILCIILTVIIIVNIGLTSY
jgi:hypothetical protein